MLALFIVCLCGTVIGLCVVEAIRSVLRQKSRQHDWVAAQKRRMTRSGFKSFLGQR